MQEAISTETARRAPEPVRYPSQTGALLRRWVDPRRHSLAVAILVFSDVLLALAIWGAAFMVQSLLGNGPLSGIAIAGIVPSVAVWVSVRALLGLYPGHGFDQAEELRRQTFALTATLGITVVFAFASQVGDSLSRLLIFAWAAGLLLLAPAMRYSAKRAMMRIGVWCKPVVVVGAREAGARVLKALRREWQLGFEPVGVFDNRAAPKEGELEGVPYRGTLADAVAMAHEGTVDTAIFAMPHTRREHLAKFVNLASSTFRHIVVIPDLDGITNSAVVARDLGGTFGVEIRHNLLDPWAQRAKRTLDILATAIGGVLIFPIILVLCLLVWAESGGPIFYRDRRMGRDGKLFACVKFRTMVPDAEALLQRMLMEDEGVRKEYLKYHKLREDPRVTRIGRFLRKTSLDELPQLWNVLRGDMSLVGPRPYLPRESEDIGATQSDILRVTPGITGPWQVYGRNHTSFDERVRMDACYVHDWSVWLDLVLLLHTMRCLLFSRDAY